MAQPLYKTLEKAGELIVAEMRSTLKQNKSNATGQLSKSISYTVKDTADGLKLQIGMLEYGGAVDKGRGPSISGGPKQSWRQRIVKWMRAKGITPEPGVKIETAAFLITRAINRGYNSKGKEMYQPKPFIDKSVDKVLNEILNEVEDDMVEIVEGALTGRK